jgi:hypothetical protein
MWVFVEVASEPGVLRQPPQPSADGVFVTDAYYVGEDAGSSERRIFKIAMKYAPDGKFSVQKQVTLGGPSNDFETLRFSLPVDEADGVLRRVEAETGVLRVWLEGPFPE